MSILTGLGVSIVVFVGVWLLSDAQRRRRTRRKQSELQAEWGRPRSFPASDGVGVYHFHRTNESRDSLDDTTWVDLNLDAVFQFLDRNESALGRERLYHRLRRTSGSAADVRGFSATVERYRADEIGTAGHSDGPVHHHRKTRFHGVGVATRHTRASSVVDVGGVPCVCRRDGYGSCRDARDARLHEHHHSGYSAQPLDAIRDRVAIYPLVAPFRSVNQIVRAAQHVSERGLATEPAKAVLAAGLPAVETLATLAGLLGRDPSRTDLASLLWEYLSFFFCIDGNILLLAIRRLSRCQHALREIAETLGDLESAVSMASVRAGTVEWTQPVFSDTCGPVEFSNLRHPLVNPCVPNSLTLGPSGVVLTGANMTGKSTFLRSVGVNAVLAQSVGTVFASSYRAPWLTVRSCINPTDDLEAGKSLYQREAETVVSIIENAAKTPVTLCLFDELFRGTNSTDRIGASAAVFRYLATGNPPCLVIAATHDLELVSVLGDHFRSYHFADRIAEDRLEFDYCLRPGIAPSRNAVALLRLFGAPSTLVADAIRVVGTLPTERDRPRY